MVLPTKIAKSLKKPIVSKSFTLVELLMVVSIISIITGATIPSFSNYIKNRTVLQAKDQLKNDLRTLQNKALANDSYDTTLTYVPDGGGSTTTGPAKYWTVKFFNNTDYYKFYADWGYSNPSTHCGSLPTDNGADNRYRSTAYLPEGSLFNMGADYCLYFGMTKAETTSSTSGQLSGTVSFTLSSQTSTVKWNYGGLVGN
jgi:prepilin-type N-terminal cleavage/methylation domain-containing protein